MSCSNSRNIKDKVDISLLDEGKIESLKLKGVSNTLAQQTTDINSNFLVAIDQIQSRFPNGGGYFIGITSDPPESPIGYNLSFLGEELLDAPRGTSYCSGSSYTVFIEGMNKILTSENLSEERLELLRMQ